MPTYQYECDACGHEFEVLQTMKEPKLKKCPKCSKLKLQRLIGAGSGMIFKGSGFYQTDYKNKGSEPKPASAPKAPCSSSCGCHPPKP
jgi:putative FmdB family regulatory protein